MKAIIFVVAAAFAVAALVASTTGKTSFEIRPAEGFVPDAETAAKISEIILVRMYGETQTNLEKPLKASLQNGAWIVKGTMPPHMLGGVAELHIAKEDARILYFSHGM